MDINALIQILIIIVVAYLIIRFIVSPIIKIILGILILLVVFYLLQRFLGFDIDQALAHFGISLNLNGWITSFNGVLGPLNRYLDQIGNIFKSIKQ